MSNLTQFIDDIEHTILSRGNHLQLIFGDVAEIKESRTYANGLCPDCAARGKKRTLSISLERAVFRCFSGSCAWGGGQWHNWYEYAHARRGVTWLEFYQSLAQDVGLEWPSLSAEGQQAYEDKLKKIDLLEAAYQLCQEHLPLAPEVMDYYASRGYSATDWEAMALGAYPGQARLRDSLLALGFDETAVQESDLISYKWETHPALWLWRDKAGRALGLMGRAINDEIEPKYLYSQAMAKSSTLPGLEKARRAEYLIITESPLGAAWLNAKGLSYPVVALGGVSLSKRQLEAIQQSGAKRIILALDMDEAGQKGTAVQIQQLLQTKEIKDIFIATWTGAKSLDDLAMTAGMSAAQQSLQQAERVGSWLAKHLLTSIPLPANLQPLEEEALLEQAVVQYLALAEHDMLQARSYVQALCDGLAITPELLWPRLDKAEKGVKEKEGRQLAENLLKKAAQYLHEGNTARYLEAVALASEAIKQRAPIKMPLPHRFEDLLRELQERPDALPLGWTAPQHLVTVPMGAYSVIAAQSGHGKTTMMLNILTNWLNMPAYRNKRFYFYGYEETEQDTLIKLLMLWAGVELHQEQNFIAYENYLKRWPNAVENRYPAIEQAIERYKQLVANGRLVLSAEQLPAEELAETIRLLGRTGETGGVIIDYIQLIPLRDNKANMRQLELQAVAQHLRAAAVDSGLAILTGSQLNDDGKVREARDILQEAALVLKLTNKGLEGDDLFVASAASVLEMSIEKQRKGIANRKFNLLLHGTTGKISDIQESNRKQPSPATTGY